MPEVPSTTHFRSARISASSAPARALRCLQPASILLYPLLALALRSLSPSAMNVVELTTKEEKDKLHADLVERLSDPSQNPYGDTDWLCQYFPMMSSMPNCRTFAAVLEEKNVGLMCSFEVRPTEIFLNGLRTDPSIRRRGFATQILKGMDSKLKAAGMTAIRMGVASWNEPMTKLSEEKLGLVGTEYCGIRCKEYAKEAEELPIRKATADDRAAIFALAHSDEMVGISGGFVQCAPGQFCAASAEYFDGVIAEGHTYVTESSDGGIGAVAVLSPNPFQPQPGLNFVAGHTDDAIITIMSGLRKYAPKPENNEENGSGGTIPVQLFGYLPMASQAIKLVVGGKVPGWERHTTTFEKVYGWEAGGLSK